LGRKVRCAGCGESFLAESFAAEKIKLREPPEPQGLFGQDEIRGSTAVMFLGIVSILMPILAIGTFIVVVIAMFQPHRTELCVGLCFLVLGEHLLGVVAGITAWAVGRYYVVSPDAPCKLQIGYHLGRIGMVVCSVGIIGWLIGWVCFAVLVAFASMQLMKQIG
jgi:hypothetical protein